MGLAIKDLLEFEEVEFSELKGKILAIDTYNMLYQFITTIRSQDGTPFMDSKGNVTSHLIGLFSRLSNFTQKGLKLCFVFDGKVPELKKRELQKRKEHKIEAQKRYDEAKDKEDIESMKKYAGRTSRLTPKMVAEAKELISSFGIPIIQAPSEGEAQASYMTKKGDCYAVVSQDFDSLMQGTPRLIRNLSITGRRKRTGKLAFQTIKPELFLLRENLSKMKLDEDQFIALGMFVGTDYNVGGIRGIGPKKAIKIVQKCHNKEDFSKVFSEYEWDEHFNYPWEEVFDLIKYTPITDDYELKWKPYDESKIRTLLVEKHEFSNERINLTIEKLEKAKKENSQKGLGEFF